MGRSSSAAAYRRGASNASARSDQWLPSTRPATALLPATMARAMATAPSHVRLAVTGDHPQGHTPGGAGPVPGGSDSQQRPSRAPAPRVTPMHALLVEVLRTR